MTGDENRAEPVEEKRVMRSTDAELHRRILAELESEPSLKDQEIGVAVHDGVATLSGYVDSYAQKAVAVRAAARVSGVTAVALGLHLRAPGQRGRPDTEIAHAVADELQSRFQHGDELRVKVEDGWVTLEGEVELFTYRQTSEEAVRHLPGVRGVTNAITIKPPELVEDIRAKVEAALMKLAHLDTKRISVETEGNKIILRGTVSSPAEERQAREAARSAAGEVVVEDQLLIAT